MDIHEARGLNPGAHGPLNIDRPIDAITNIIKQLEVPSTDGISWHSAIHRLDIDGVLSLLNPPSRRKSIIRALVQLVDLGWRQGRDELPDVDEIELLFPCPLLGNIVNFKDAVWWHPLLGWWKEIHAADYEIREFGRNVDCPVALPSTNVQDVVGVLGDWGLEEGVLLQGVENAEHNMARFHGFDCVVSEGWTAPRTTHLHCFSSEGPQYSFCIA